MPNVKAVEEWLSTVEVLTDEKLIQMSTADRAQLEALLGHRGMALFLGLVLGTRQAKLIMLANMRLSSPENIHVASVTQGQIQGIDLIWQTLLELATPTQSETNEGAKA